jgi:hypothetical protein
MQLPTAPTCKGHQDVTGIIRNMTRLNSGFPPLQKDLSEICVWTLRHICHLYHKSKNLRDVTKSKMCKGKGKFYPITGHEGPNVEYRCSCTLPLTSVIEGVGSQRHTPAVLPPEKTRYPLYRRVGGPQVPSGWVRKISPPPPGFDPRTVQPVASPYTD